MVSVVMLSVSIKPTIPSLVMLYIAMLSVVRLSVAVLRIMAPKLIVQPDDQEPTGLTLLSLMNI